MQKERSPMSGAPEIHPSLTAVCPSCKIVASMEIFLNLAWLVVAMVSVALWLRHERRTGKERRLPLIALAMLLLVLFPVISVSDDLWSIQNPAETDAAQRRDQIAPFPHCLLPAVAPPLASLLAVVHPEIRLISAPAASPSHAYEDPARDEIENRPPPAA